MKAMIFAAGRGNRLRPLTDSTPKPLIKVRGRPLILWHILNLVKAGITDIVINHAHLGEQIEKTLGDGSKWGANIVYSPEKIALETAGGVAFARELLGEKPFVGIAADAFCPHFDYSEVLNVLPETDLWGKELKEKDLAWLYLVPKPDYLEKGDFSLNLFSVSNVGEKRLTFSGIGVYRMELFNSIQKGQTYPLGKLLREYADKGLVGGEVLSIDWADVGTIERLNALNKKLSL